jgi:uncharacterized protein YcnI
MKIIFQLCSAIILCLLTNTAFAHMLNSAVGSSKSNEIATDEWLVSCGKDDAGVSNKLDVQIKTNSPKSTATAPNYAHLNVQVIKDSNASSAETDPINGDPYYSNFASLVAGSGDYTVKVTKPVATSTSCFAKPANKAYTYTMQYHCKSADGNHTPTDISQRGNQ